MFGSYIARAFAVVGLAVGLTAVPGCLVASSSNTTYSGTRVAESTFEQIKAGSTTMGWVNATLGAPTSKAKTGNDEVWKYIYTETTDSSGAVFLLFAGSSSKENTGAVFIEFRDGVVINKWRA